MFSALSLLVFCFLFFFEALVLARSLSFGNLVSRSCSTYFDKVTTFSLLKISFSSSVSHETMADFIVSFNCNRVFWYKGQVARKCRSSSIIGSNNGRCDSVSASGPQHILHTFLFHSLGDGCLISIVQELVFFHIR